MLLDSGSSSLRVLAAPLCAKDGNANNYLLYANLQHFGVEVFDGFTIAKARKVDICHMHWPEYAALDPSFRKRLTRSCTFFAQLVALKLFGARLVWTVHNLYPHDVPVRRSMRAFYFLLLHLTDGLIFLSHGSRDLCHSKYPESRSCASAVIPESHYRTVFPPVRRKHSTPWKELDDQKRILFFGVIRPYKHLERLIDAFNRMSRKNVRLVCSGAPFADADYMSEIRRLVAANPKIHLRLEWTSLKDTAELFDRASLVVVPYRELNSGIPLLSVSLNRPVLAPDTDAVVEMQRVVGEDWIMTYRGDLTPDVLSRALEWATPGRTAKPDLSSFESADIARQTLAFYHQVRNGSPARTRNPVSPVSRSTEEHGQ